METFNFPFHTVETTYPESSVRVQFGRSYVFAAAPDAPDQRKFKLVLPGLKFFFNVTTGLIDATINPQRNLRTLENFYTAHRLFTKFIYPHPAYGNVVVRFNAPFRIPAGIKGGDSMVGDIEIELIEVP